MRPRVIVAAAALTAAAIGAGVWLARTPDPVVERRTDTGVASREAPAMCPWRDPKGDLARFFPGATDYRQELLSLSPLRLKILKRLGPGAPLESNALYLYRVERRGAVLVRRAAGAFGAIEVVVAVGTDRRIVGVRVQSHREPPPTGDRLRSEALLKGFVGKGPDDPLPDAVPALAQTVHSLLVEFDEAEAAR